MKSILYIELIYTTDYVVCCYACFGLLRLLRFLRLLFLNDFFILLEPNADSVDDAEDDMPSEPPF